MSTDLLTPSSTPVHPGKANEPARTARIQVCTRCVMDSTDPEIEFDERGVCSRCTAWFARWPSVEKMQPDADDRLNAVIDRISRRGRGREYDCVIGLSGGVDSTYLALVLVERFGLRPIAVHMDNGWNSELAVFNVERIVKRLDLDLISVVLDWEEFRSLQLAFMRASVPDIEIPTDHAIAAAMFEVAQRMRIPFVISGNNFETEGVVVPSWSQGNEWNYIKGINKLHGTMPLRTFPHRSFSKKVWQERVLGIRRVALLNYLPFNVETVVSELQSKLDWRPYPSKHYESVFTKFHHGYWLPRKFDADYRKAYLASLVCAGQLSRDRALGILQKPPVDEDEVPDLEEFVQKKLRISPDELSTLMENEPKSYWDYPNFYNSGAYRFADVYLRPIYNRTIRGMVVRARERAL